MTELKNGCGVQTDDEIPAGWSLHNISQLQKSRLIGSVERLVHVESQLNIMLNRKNQFSFFTYLPGEIKVI